MKIKSIILFTNQLSKQRNFYTQILGFELLEEALDSFAIQVGYRKLKFKKSEEDFKYHYCFLIPANKLKAPISWLKDRLELIHIDGDRGVKNFESWNADSVYFYDGAANLAEFIVRYDLKNDTNEAFDLAKILCVNDIDMPTNNVAKINGELQEKINSRFWKGDMERFATNGAQDRLFLLINSEIKKTWFPTEVRTQSSPFEGTVKVA